MVCFFCESFLRLVFIFVMSVSCSLVVNCWERADLLAHLYLTFYFVFCPFPIWCPWSDVVPDCIDSCS